ncbi:protein of unknown function [Microbacterium sp. Nx66]|nr:protein of unknown function [Microbacterium sp. Nx66]
MHPRRGAQRSGQDAHERPVRRDDTESSPDPGDRCANPLGRREQRTPAGARGDPHRRSAGCRGGHARPPRGAAGVRPPGIPRSLTRARREGATLWSSQIYLTHIAIVPKIFGGYGGADTAVGSPAAPGLPRGTRTFATPHPHLHRAAELRSAGASHRGEARGGGT